MSATSLTLLFFLFFIPAGAFAESTDGAEQPAIRIPSPQLIDKFYETVEGREPTRKEREGTTVFLAENPIPPPTQPKQRLDTLQKYFVTVVGHPPDVQELGSALGFIDKVRALREAKEQFNQANNAAGPNDFFSNETKNIGGPGESTGGGLLPSGLPDGPNASINLIDATGDGTIHDGTEPANGDPSGSPAAAAAAGTPATANGSELSAAPPSVDAATADNSSEAAKQALISGIQNGSVAPSVANDIMKQVAPLLNSGAPLDDSQAARIASAVGAGLQDGTATPPSPNAGSGGTASSTGTVETPGGQLPPIVSGLNGSGDSKAAENRNGSGSDAPYPAYYYGGYGEGTAVLTTPDGTYGPPALGSGTGTGGTAGKGQDTSAEMRDLLADKNQPGVGPTDAGATASSSGGTLPEGKGSSGGASGGGNGASAQRSATGLPPAQATTKAATATNNVKNFIDGILARLGNKAIAGKVASRSTASSTTLPGESVLSAPRVAEPKGLIAEPSTVAEASLQGPSLPHSGWDWIDWSFASAISLVAGRLFILFRRGRA